VIADEWPWLDDDALPARIPRPMRGRHARSATAGVPLAATFAEYEEMQETCCPSDVR
jgi:hypothetical protein